jgi:hypothetical protein
MHCL